MPTGGQRKARHEPDETSAIVDIEPVTTCALLLAFEISMDLKSWLNYPQLPRVAAKDAN